jgi:hypothetical protein
VPVVGKGAIVHKAFFKGIVVGSVVSIVVLLAATAMAGTGIGGVFNLGQSNTVNAPSTLKGSTSGKNLQLTNTGSGGGLGITVAAGKAPITVNQSAGKATNLNADKLDGMTSSSFLTVTGKAADSDKLDGLDSTDFLPASKLVRFGPTIVQAASGQGEFATLAVVGELTFFAECIDTGQDQLLILHLKSSSAHASFAATAGTTFSSNPNMGANGLDFLASSNPAHGSPVFLPVTGEASTSDGQEVFFNLYAGQNAQGASNGQCLFGGAIEIL